MEASKDLLYEKVQETEGDPIARLLVIVFHMASTGEITKEQKGFLKNMVLCQDDIIVDLGSMPVRTLQDIQTIRTTLKAVAIPALAKYSQPAPAANHSTHRENNFVNGVYVGPPGRDLNVELNNGGFRKRAPPVPPVQVTPAEEDGNVPGIPAGDGPSPFTAAWSAKQGREQREANLAAQAAQNQQAAYAQAGYYPTYPNYNQGPPPGGYPYNQNMQYQGPPPNAHYPYPPFPYNNEAAPPPLANQNQGYPYPYPYQQQQYDGPGNSHGMLSANTMSEEVSNMSAPPMGGSYPPPPPVASQASAPASQQGQPSSQSNQNAQQTTTAPPAPPMSPTSPLGAALCNRKRAHMKQQAHQAAPH
eukprot:Platyproteum_vivax@DN6268_c0_g1_i1.p1